jgi:hypothetical protein
MLTYACTQVARQRVHACVHALSFSLSVSISVSLYLSLSLSVSLSLTQSHTHTHTCAVSQNSRTAGLHVMVKSERECVRAIEHRRPKQSRLRPLQSCSLLHQYVYFCTSEASKLRERESERRRLKQSRLRPLQSCSLLRQHVYFCTSKASKLSSRVCARSERVMHIHTPDCCQVSVCALGLYYY